MRNIISILLIFVCIFFVLDFSCIHQPLWYPLEYRLGDAVCVWSSSRCYNPFTQYRIWSNYPQTSIAYQYTHSTRFPQQWQILNNIVQTKNIPKCYKNIPIVIHLRLGDVIENHKRTVQDFWDGVGFTLKMQYIEQYEGFIRPRQFYECVHDHLSHNNKNMKHVIILTGTHKPIQMIKSKQYVKCVESFFKEHGYSVFVKESIPCSIEDADIDFSIMCKGKVFIPSGGNFSRSAGKCVELSGGSVITPELFNLHTK
jgi:hypothetical protein